MTILATKTCVTCAKPCYPTERLMVSDLWVHKAGCMKCSACSATLSLNSVYVAPAPSDPSRKLLWCAKDVPKMVHTSVVDSIALKTAMNAPKCTSTPAAVFAKSKSQGKTLRFKGLTLRSKSIALGLNAPKPEYSNGRQQAQQIFVGHVGAGLDAWDIAHAMAVQSQVRSPIRSHDAIRAQHTGSAAGRGISPNVTDRPAGDGGGQESEEITSAKTGEESVSIEPDLVRNLVRVFQLDSMDAVEVTSASNATANDALVPEVIFDVADYDGDEDDGIYPASTMAHKADVDEQEQAPRMTIPGSNDVLLAALPGTIGRSTFYSTLRPSSSVFSALTAHSIPSKESGNSLASLSSTSDISASSAASECGTYRANGMGSFRSTLTVRTLGTIGSKRGTLTLARIKGTLRRPALSGLFAQQESLKVEAPCDEQVTGSDGHDDDGERIVNGLLDVETVPNAPANTPIKSPYAHASRPTVPRSDSRYGTLKGPFATNTENGPAKEGYTHSMRGTSLLKALLPVAAHLIPMPDEVDDGELLNGEGGGYFREAQRGPLLPAQADIEDEEEDDAVLAEQTLLDSLEMGGLELIMMFEEEAEPLPVTSGIFL